MRSVLLQCFGTIEERAVQTLWNVTILVLFNLVALCPSSLQFLILDSSLNTHDFRLPPRSSWGLRYSALLRT